MPDYKSLKRGWSVSLTFALHDFQSQYLDSILGFIWALIKPLVLSGVYVVIFSSVVPPQGEDGESLYHFGLWVVSGMLPWFVIQESIHRGTFVFLDSAHLIRNHQVPLYVLPLQLVVSATISGLLALPVFILLKLLLGGGVNLSYLSIVLIIPLQLLFCFGITLITSSLTVFIRDVNHMVIALLTIWFFASPIVFPLEGLPWLLQQYWLNPMVSITSLYRQSLLLGCFPPAADWFWLVLHVSAVLLVGSWVYTRVQAVITDWV